MSINIVTLSTTPRSLPSRRPADAVGPMRRALRHGVDREEAKLEMFVAKTELTAPVRREGPAELIVPELSSSSAGMHQSPARVSTELGL